MSNYDFSTPRRQSSKGLILYFILSAQRTVRSAWPLILIYFVRNDSLSERQKSLVLFGIILILAIMLVHSIISYLKFYFYIEDGEFKVSKGYLKKVNLSIPLERIQTINSKQNIFQQWLKVVSVEVDTAGAAAKELKIIALDKETANALSSQLNTGKKEEPDTEITEVPVEESKLILKLGIIDLLKVGISENHIRSILVIVGFGMSIIDRIREFFSDTIDEAAESARNFLIASDVIILVMLLIFILFVGIAFSVIVTFFRHFDLRFLQEGQKFHLRSGLLNKKAVTIPYSKIQVLTWSTNPIRKLMDFVTLNLAQATSTANNQQRAIEIPGCSTKNLKSVQKEVFPLEDEPDYSQHQSHRNYALRLWFFTGFIPVAFSVLFWKLYIIVLISAIVWFILSIGVCYLAFKKRFFRISPELIENSSGSVGQRFSRMFNFKIQSIKYRQTIFQRRRNLATIRIYTAGGKIMTIPYIDKNLAFELYNYLLYTAESSEKKWM